MAFSIITMFIWLGFSSVARRRLVRRVRRVRIRTVTFLSRSLASRGAAFTHDLLMIPAAWLGSYWIRFNLNPVPTTYLDQAISMLPFIVLIQGAIYWYFGLYRGIWRFASFPDLIRIAKAVVVGTLVCSLAVFLFNRMQYVPRSVIPIYALLLFGLLSVPRGAYRWLKNSRMAPVSAKRVLVIGSGETAEMLVRSLLRYRHQAYYPVALVDDRPSNLGREIHGVRVVGTLSELPKIANKYDIDLIAIAVTPITAARMRRIVESCEKAGVEFRTLPQVSDLVSGEVTVNELQEVSIEDLLGREPVDIEWQSVAAFLNGKRVLVSGGGGSIGAELCRQVARFGPTELIILEQGEFNLFNIEQELRREFPDLELQARLGDVCDSAMVDSLVATYRPDITFHAAAYKHVPLLQQHAREAVKNNILGTQTMAEAAHRHGTGVFVFISTDKAVKPVNVLGASKRVGEMLCQDINGRSRTAFITVRFGNVLGSAGSVVPLFKQQIAAGGPVTVTDPEVTRYFMTVPEATQLIIQASMLGKGGEVFVLDMGDPVKIGYLAEQMIKLSGKRPGVDIQITHVGLRPGEKHHEVLFDEHEKPVPTLHEKILLAQPRGMSTETLKRALTQMRADVERCDDELLLQRLTQLFPELSVAVQPAVRDNVISLQKGKP